MALIHRCAQCGKKGFLLPLNEAGLCNQCCNANRLAALEEEKAKTESFYNSLAVLFHTVVIDTSKCTLDDVKLSLKECDHLINELKRIPDFSKFSEVFLSHCRRIYDTFVINDDFGDLYISDNKIDMASFLDQAERTRETCTQIVNATEEFNKLLNEIPLVKIDIKPEDFSHTVSLTSTISLKTTNITKRTSLAKLNLFISIDVETTGLNPMQNEIIQLSAIKFLGWQPVEAFHTFVKPRKGLNPRAQEINGITDADVEDAPYIESIMSSFASFIGKDIPIVGHNISFDYNFLLLNGCRELLADRKYYDTLDISKREFSSLDKFSLDYLCRKKLSLIRTECHNSLSDALATGLLFKKICDLRISR